MKRMVFLILFLFVVAAVATSVRRPGSKESLLRSVNAAQAEADLTNEGVGLYSDASVVMQNSAFTINPRKVSCAVGTVVPNGTAGPFEMLMYSVGTHNYSVNPLTRTITASGRMRSITRVAGLIIEDVHHDFIAVAVDNQPGHPQPNRADRFDTHFASPFWNLSNPMCTPSPLVPGGCRFGGQLFLGDVSVSSQ
jgi:hypothetical protein